MTCPKVSKPCAWIEGETTVRNLLTDLSNAIVNAEIPLLNGGVEQSKWKILYKEREFNYVTYEIQVNSVQGRFKNPETGLISTVYRIPKEPSNYKAPDGYFYEAVENSPIGQYTDTNESIRTGKRISFQPFYYNGKYYEIENALVTLVDMYPDLPLSAFEYGWQKYQAYIVKHTRINYLGEEVEDTNWNYFKLVAPLPDDWTYFLYKGSTIRVGRYQQMIDNIIHYFDRTLTIRQDYTVQHYTFKPTYYEVPEKLVLQCNTNDGRSYNVYFEKPIDSNNYLKVQYGVEIVNQKNLSGLPPEESYRYACDPNSIGKGKTPVVIDENEAYKAYERQVNNLFEVGELELGGIKSPVSYWFFSENSTKSWMPNKMRGLDSVVRYWISFNNDRAIIVLEGDPNFDFDSFYRSLAYIGKFNTLNENDVENNFAITVGMGALEKDKSGFTIKDIDKKQNTEYAKYGVFTSNGMDTISVYRGISKLPFQEYVPAFLIHLPNYPNVGTLPSGIQRLILPDHLFNPSQWTDHIHSSPIYLVHGYEGYRGFLDGIVAIYDQNLLNGDELDYDVGNYTEVYKFINIKVPVCFLDKSPAPGGIMSVAILKEIKRSDS